MSRLVHPTRLLVGARQWLVLFHFTDADVVRASAICTNCSGFTQVDGVAVELTVEAPAWELIYDVTSLFNLKITLKAKRRHPRFGQDHADEVSVLACLAELQLSG